MHQSENIMFERIKGKFSDVAVEYYYSESLESEKKMFAFQLQVNKAHVVMLYEQGILSKTDAREILGVVVELEKQGVDALELSPYLEDLYINIETYILKSIGEDIGGKMHIGRSRNDLEPTISRIVLKNKVNLITEHLIELRGVLIELAESNVTAVMPGYTHWQQAQPVSFAHYLMAIVDALERDLQRLESAYTSIDLNPLGGAALASTGFPINRKRTTELLGFAGILENSLDAVSARDFMVEVVSDLAMVMLTLNRLSSDIIRWSANELAFVEVDDGYADSSTIMPQKKNPVMPETVRAEAGIVIGALNSIMNAFCVPYEPCRDLSVGERILWGVTDKVVGMIKITTGFMGTLRINTESMLKKATEGFCSATELADTIVREKGLSFRKAHRVVGAIVYDLIRQGAGPDDLTSELVNRISNKVLGESLELDHTTIRKALDPLENIKVRSVIGGPAPKEVQRMIRVRKDRLNAEKHRVEMRKQIIEKGREDLELAVQGIVE